MEVPAASRNALSTLAALAALDETAAPDTGAGSWGTAEFYSGRLVGGR
jgi:hypothetical protein